MAGIPAEARGSRRDLQRLLDLIESLLELMSDGDPAMPVRDAAQDFNRSIGLDASFTPAHLLLSDTYKKIGLDSLAQAELAAGNSGGERPRMETVTGVGR